MREAGRAAANRLRWSIPAHWYADAQVYRLEQERIFAREWMLIGFAARGGTVLVSSHLLAEMQHLARSHYLAPGRTFGPPRHTHLGRTAP